jgi:addiction module HigA family antidote
MIRSFKSKETEKVWNGERSSKLPLEVQKVGRRKLRMLNNSYDINDLRIPPANRLEKLSGNLAEFYSIRINDKWRIIFMWSQGHAFEVQIIDYHKWSTMTRLKNIHPGEVLSEEFLKPLSISAYRLSKDIGIPQTRISSILKGNRRITADTALRLSKYFGNSAKFWLGLQNDFDIEEELIANEQVFRNIPKRENNAA